MYPELAYGHAKLARQTVARVLARKVERKVFSKQEAAEIGKQLLYDNAARVYSWNEGRESPA